MFEIINFLFPGPKTSFRTYTSVADTAAVNPNSAKILLANCVSTFFINGEGTFVNRAIKLSNLPSRILFVLAIPFNKSPLFSKDLITFGIYYIPLFVSVISEPALVLNVLLSSLIAFLE